MKPGSSISKNSASKAGVLIVDDHPLICDWLSRLINEEPDLSVCGTADTVNKALQAAAQLKPDIITVDIGLRGRSGLELIRELIIQNTEEKILVLTMHEEVIYASRALKAGARGYITKIETSEKVIQALRRVLKGGIYLTESCIDLLAGGKIRTEGATLDVSLLSDRELEVFRLLAMGKETVEIARELSVSPKTIQSYSARIKEKLNLRNAIELLQTATRWMDAQNLG